MSLMSTDTINYKEEYEKLKEEMITLQERYFKARDEGIRRGSYAALLSGNKPDVTTRSRDCDQDSPRLKPVSSTISITDIIRATIW